MIRELIKKRIKEVSCRLEELRSRDLSCVLIVDKSNGYAAYYKRQNGKKQYVRKDNVEQLKALAQNTYVKKMVEAAQKELESLKKCLIVLEKSSAMESVYKNMAKELRDYIEPCAPDDEYAKAWQEDRKRCRLKPPPKKYKTMRGEYVRSKSELIIADRLFALGIPYHYERPVFINSINDFYHPDFTILNKRTRKVVYWEHLGMMGEEGYRVNNIQKIDDYATEGIVVGKNLVVTFESNDANLSTELVDTMIRELFL